MHTFQYLSDVHSVLCWLVVVSWCGVHSRIVPLPVVLVLLNMALVFITVVVYRTLEAVTGETARDEVFLGIA